MQDWYFETGQLRNMKTNKWRKNLSGRRIEMGLCFAKRSLEGWGSEEKKNFFGNFVSPEAKGWCHEGKSIEFGFTNEECVFLKENTFEWGKPNSMDFPEGHQPFAEGETKLPKKNFFSEIHHPSNDLEAKQNTSLNSPETQIFEAFVCFYIANLPCFSIFCYLTKLIFFPFCWILNAGNGVFNRWFNWFSNLQVKKC